MFSCRPKSSSSKDKDRSKDSSSKHKHSKDELQSSSSSSGKKKKKDKDRDREKEKEKEKERNKEKEKEKEKEKQREKEREREKDKKKKREKEESRKRKHDSSSDDEAEKAKKKKHDAGSSASLWPHFVESFDPVDFCQLCSCWPTFQKCRISSLFFAKSAQIMLVFPQAVQLRINKETQQCCTTSRGLIKVPLVRDRKRRKAQLPEGIEPTSSRVMLFRCVLYRCATIAVHEALVV